MPVPPGELAEITLRSLIVSGASTLIGSAIAIPAGAWMALSRFRGRRVARTILYTLYGFPPVVAGLLVFLLLSGQGPMGRLELLFSLTAMVLAELILVIPIVAGVTLSSVADVDPAVLDTARGLGADERQLRRLALRQARSGILTGVMVAFGGAVSEVGAAMLVGGNVRHQTRVLTTAIVLETRMGNFDYAAALGGVLLAISFVVYWFLVCLQDRKGR